MSIIQQWIIGFGDRTFSADVTNRTLGFSTETVVGIAELGRMQCVITLDNNDGAFTPAEGGGTGTYKDIDWYSQQLKIDVAFTGRVAELFNGIIRDFDISDNGINSYVTLRAVDWLQVASSELFDLTADSTSLTGSQAFEKTLEGIDGWGDGLSVPKFGAPTVSNNFTFLRTGNPDIRIERPALTNVTTKDIVSTVLIPSGPFMHIPGPVLLGSLPASANTFSCGIVPPSLENTRGFLDVIEFDETGSTSPVKLPFTDLIVGFNTDDITNICTTVSEVAGTTQQTTTDATSLDRYGSRARRYSQLASPSDTELQRVAGFWTDRQSTVRYTPTRLKFTVETIDATLSDTADVREMLAEVMSMNSCLFKQVAVTYAPTGGATMTVPLVTKSRRIDARPGSVTITLDLLPAQDYQSLILDSSTIGVLDQNRLG